MGFSLEAPSFSIEVLGFRFQPVGLVEASGFSFQTLALRFGALRFSFEGVERGGGEAPSPGVQSGAWAWNFKALAFSLEAVSLSRGL